jgi:hypothetical protein
VVADEHMIIDCTSLSTTSQVAVQTRLGRGVQWHETALPELGLADQQPICREIGKL